MVPEPIESLVGPLAELERLNAPAELYVAGDRALLRRSPKVAIVGSRNASVEGRRRAAKLARLLAERDVVIISGLAEGIDTSAHTATIEAGGRTIGVIGTPLDQVFPRRNAALQAEIASRHLLVSQFAPGSPVGRSGFPLRNRTMALFADASVIVEAADRSGSLSHGWEAIRLGRPLFILRSVLDRPELAWPRDMLAYGAQVLEDVEPLFEALPVGDPTTVSF
jgi:DNA processing protein